jgi:hypothetical protein
VVESGGGRVIGGRESVVSGESGVLLGGGVVSYGGVGGRYGDDVGVETGTLSVVVPASEVGGPESLVVVGGVGMSVG